MSKVLAYAAPPLLLTLGLPLMLWASVTTAIAFSILILRAFFVYFELATTLIKSAILPSRHASPESSVLAAPLTPYTEKIKSQPGRPRSAGGCTPSTPTRDGPIPRTGSFAALAGHSSSTRDFEGVGGWRLSGDARDDEAWESFNSKLELPAMSAGEKQRRHQRTLSSQSQHATRTSEAFRMSPVDSKARTPVATSSAAPHTEYFSFRPSDPIPMSPEESIAKNRMEERRRSISSGSTGSGGTAVASTGPT